MYVKVIYIYMFVKEAIYTIYSFMFLYYTLYIYIYLHTKGYGNCDKESRILVLSSKKHQELFQEFYVKMIGLINPSTELLI